MLGIFCVLAGVVCWIMYWVKVSCNSRLLEQPMGPGDPAAVGTEQRCVHLAAMPTRLQLSRLLELYLV
jgi:hypothetical protein